MALERHANNIVHMTLIDIRSLSWWRLLKVDITNAVLRDRHISRGHTSIL